MTPAERGRHCAVCDKVVRDFVGMKPDAIFAELRQATGNICGMLDRSVVSTEPLKEQVWAKYPLERLRVFVLAFVLVFGVEVWGVSEVDAQTVQPEIEKLQTSGVLTAVVRDSAAVIRLAGKVEDVYTLEAVMQARISVYQAGKLIDGGWTKEDGTFSIEIPSASLVGDTFDLQLYHNGKIRWDSGIHRDLREFHYLIDASTMLKGIEIEADISRYVRGELISLGSVVYRDSGLDQKSLYRPLDEWLMMHNSEINHTGRW